jgi:hypothetical protein
MSHMTMTWVDRPLYLPTQQMQSCHGFNSLSFPELPTNSSKEDQMLVEVFWRKATTEVQLFWLHQTLYSYTSSYMPHI